MVSQPRGKASPRVLAPVIAAAALLGAVSCKKDVDPVAAKAGDQLFKERCAVCHSPPPGQARLAPDLAGVTDRRSDEWIANWLTDTPRMQATDPVGQQLLQQWKIPMPPQNLTPEQVRQLIAYFHSTGG